jgi:thiamine-phosphate pyrophosphorylase
MALADPHARLRAARLYLVCGLTPGGRPLADVLGPALAAGVDVFQLRAKEGTDAEIMEAAAHARALCERVGALFILNDRADLASEVGADGVHLGQDDITIDAARKLIGSRRLIGRSTHSPEQIDAAPGVDYIGVGPVYATPTKPGVGAVGLELVRYAAAHAAMPWFAIGGIEHATIDAVIDAGATRIAVVRAIADAPDPGAAAAELVATVTRTDTALRATSASAATLVRDEFDDGGAAAREAADRASAAARAAADTTVDDDGAAAREAADRAGAAARAAADQSSGG